MQGYLNTFTGEIPAAFASTRAHWRRHKTSISLWDKGYTCELSTLLLLLSIVELKISSAFEITGGSMADIWLEFDQSTSNLMQAPFANFCFSRVATHIGLVLRRDGLRWFLIISRKKCECPTITKMSSLACLTYSQKVCIRNRTASWVSFTYWLNIVMAVFFLSRIDNELQCQGTHSLIFIYFCMSLQQVASTSYWQHREC